MNAIKKRKQLVLCVLLLAVVLYGTNAFHVRQRTRSVARAVLTVGLKLEYRISGRNTPFVPVLMYHSVNDAPLGAPELSVRPHDFDAQMQYLSQNGYTPITFDELAAAGRYKKPILITFDDGYRDNFTEAYPILKKYGFHATLFMISGDIGAPNFLNGDDILAMSDFISIQSHTVRHLKLSTLSRDEIAFELHHSKEVIEALTGKPVTALSYPEGDYNKTVLKLVAKEYRWAVTTKYGLWHNGMDRYRIRRLAVGRGMPLKRFARLVAAG